MKIKKNYICSTRITKGITTQSYTTTGGGFFMTLLHYKKKFSRMAIFSIPCEDLIY